LGNTLEAKIKQQSDTGSVLKKVSLIDNFNIGVSYNVAVKQYQWSNINLSGNTKLFKVLNLSASATLDPYQIDSAGNHIERFEWAKQRIGRLTNAGVSLGANFRSKVNTTPKPKTSDKGTQDELDYINAHPDAYMDFNVPWNFGFAYNINYTTPVVNNLVTIKVIQSVSFNGDVSVTKKWKVSGSSGYDFINKKFTVTNINIYRDLHCWEMRFRWVPFGFGQSFNLDLNVKSAMLKDLKLTRKKDWYDY
jgi:hypothetical protein